MEDKLYNFRIQPAERLSSVQEYYFSVKLKEVARMNAEGQDIISLAIGSPDMPPSPQTIETLCEEARHADAHGYQPTTGIPELRRAMADFYKRWYDVDLDPACEIQPLIGSKEGILHVTLAVANPGDRVLVPNPDTLLIRHSAKSSANESPIMTCCPKTAGNLTSKPWKKWT